METCKTDIAHFSEQFHSQKEEIEKKLEKTSTIKNIEVRNEHFNDLAKLLDKLQENLTESVNFLRPYDVRVCQEALQNLRKTFHKQHESMVPKKKFAFKSRKRETEKIEKVDDDDDLVDGPQKITEKTNYGIRDLKEQKLVKKREEINGQDVDIQRLEKCQVFIYGSANTVHLNGLKNCLVFCGPVKTSVFLEGCTDCVFMLACQQLRAHSSVDCDFYLHVTSSAIIEDCSRVRVAPYEFSYDKIDEDFVEAGLDRSCNHWEFVNDFNWLAADMPSPNWTLIPSHERKGVKDLV